MPATQGSAHVAILLCAYNGARFLSEQLGSIENQSHSDWKVWVSDDGSTDGTLALLEQYRLRWGENRLAVVSGPKKGFAANFLSLACRPEIDADYFSYSDQDDIWEKDKLRRAISMLSVFGNLAPTLYCGRTKLVDERGQFIGLSPLFMRQPDFRNALVQNVGGGNTMVFSRTARHILLDAGADIDVVAHDWWTYVAISGAGGQVIYDSEPTLLYRQHGQNLIGSNNGWLARFSRVRLLMHGQLRSWIDANISALQRIGARLSEPNRRVFDEFVSSRQGGAARRLIGLKRSGVFRQTLMGNLGLITAAFFKKL
jgi:glycosyltransferase involved in cell wall biosynthesis